MSQFRFKVKDYRIIKEADVSPEGITLLYARNGAGKSTLLKSLVSLLSNKHSEANFRHGKDSYSISARVDDNEITYTRTGSTSQVQFNNESPKSKLGFDPLSKVEPRFPLKRVDFMDSSFYPHISFQNSVPVFNDISVAELFSAMFSDMSRLSERVTGCRNDCVNTARVKNDSQANSDMLKGKVSEAKKQVSRINAENPNLISQYSYLLDLARKREAQTKFLAEYQDISAQCSDFSKRALVSLYKDAQPLFSDLSFASKMRGVLSQYDRTKADLGVVRSEYSNLASAFPVDVDSLVSGVKQMSTLQSSLTSVRVNLDAIPDVPSSLVSSGVTLVSLKKILEGVNLEIKDLPIVSDTLISEVQDLASSEASLQSVRVELGNINASYDKVMAELKSLPCERLAGGLCPYQAQINIGG